MTKVGERWVGAVTRAQGGTSRKSRSRTRAELMGQGGQSLKEVGVALETNTRG